MKPIPNILVFSAVGLLGGWMVAGSHHRKDHDDEIEATSPAGNLNPLEKPARPARDTFAGPADVRACREILARPPEAGSHPLLRRYERAVAMRRWIELDPQGALAEAELDPAAGFGKELFRAWIELDPAAALEAFNRASRPLATGAVGDFFVDLMNRDPVLAADEMRKDKWWNAGSVFLGWDFHRTVMRQWFIVDPSAAIAALGVADEKVEQDQDLLAIAHEWAAVDFAATWARFGPAPDGGKTPSWFAQELLARGLMAGSPQALRALDQIPNETHRMGSTSLNMRASVAEKMVSVDREAALKWAMSRPADDPLRLQVIGQSAAAIAGADPARALAMLAESGSEIDDYRVSSIPRAAFATWAADDRDGAAEMIRSQPDPWKTGAISGYLTQVFATDPEAAIAQCRTWLADPDMKSHLPEAWAVAFSSSHGAGLRDPGEMLAAFPELNDAVDENVLSTWTKANPESAAEWISQRLEDGRQVDFGKRGVLAELAISKPEFTATWLQGLPDAVIQSQAAETLTANWAAFDEKAARAWADSLEAGALRDAAEKGFTRINNSR